ncbi:hypothetical protein [Nakamurella leprariae]|uniref:Uncharacterized protein n=1 Tax=Nakamurella leprariae TaxID=2803911 RepID=A0A938YFA4_9ACTN|nr:hypothetical protein [Nakamurella leprariae]MBM9466743.1 hypothetical protein [Nakamurella leprariae]
MFPLHGPGAGGVGWDLALVAPARLLAGGDPQHVAAAVAATTWFSAPDPT